MIAQAPHGVWYLAVFQPGHQPMSTAPDRALFIVGGATGGKAMLFFELYKAFLGDRSLDKRIADVRNNHGQVYRSPWCMFRGRAHT